MSNKNLYRTICEQHPSLPVFLQYWWLDMVCDKWEVAITQKGDKVTGVWPYPIEEKAGVSLLRTPMLTPYFGPHVFYPHDLKDSKRDGFEYTVVKELVKQLPDAKVWHLAMFPGFKQAGILRHHGVEVQVQQTFLIDLQEEEQVLLGNLKDNYRRYVKADIPGITITEEPGLLEDLYRFQGHTLEGKGKTQPYSLAEMQRLFDACKANNAGTLWALKEGSNTEAIIWQLWDADCSYYYMGAQNPEGDSYRAKTLLLWHAIREAKKRGCKAFDFEGSMDPDVEKFFRGFGGTRELYMVLRKNDSLLWKLKQMVRK